MIVVFQFFTYCLLSLLLANPTALPKRLSCQIYCLDKPTVLINQSFEKDPTIHIHPRTDQNASRTKPTPPKLESPPNFATFN